MRPALYPILLADPLPWAAKAPYAWDFLRDRARFAGGYKGALTNTPGWSYTRSDAQTAYAQTSAGVLTPFATGVLRRTDKGVLIEGARTNLCLQSQTFGTTWVTSETTVSADTAVAPDGTTTADTLIESSNTIEHNVQQSFSKAASAITYSSSLYVKRTGGAARNVQLRMDTGSAANSVIVPFDLGAVSVGTATVAGTFAHVGSTITALANGWYQLVTVFTTGTETALRYRVGLQSGANATYAGDGTSGLYLWGAQLEAASFPSSYIPTTTASATRAADDLTVPVSGIESAPLSAYVEFTVDALTSAERGLLVIDDGVGSANIAAYLYGSTSNTGKALSYASGATQMDAGATAFAALSVNKLAMRAATNDGRVCQNGTLQTADTSFVLCTTLNRVAFGTRYWGTSNQPFGYLRRAAIFTRALTDSELQTVTT